MQNSYKVQFNITVSWEQDKSPKQAVSKMYLFLVLAALRDAFDIDSIGEQSRPARK